jgi:ligand-binding sensor domain-containing protein
MTESWTRISRLIVTAAALLLACAPSSLALAPWKAISQYRLDAWGVNDGLPAQTIKAITQTSEGYVWLATTKLIRFDGVRFTTFDTVDDKAKLPPIGALAASPDGSLWMSASAGGVFRYVDGRLTRAPAPLEWLRGPGILAARDGSVWAPGRAGMVQVRDGVVALQSQTPITAQVIAEATDGSVYAGLWDDSVGGLVRLQGGVATFFGQADGLASRHVTALAAARDGTLWIGTRHGLTAFRGARFRTYGITDGLSSDVVSALHEDRDGSLWIGTRGGGLCRRRDDRFTCLRKADGLVDDHISALFEDNEGGLWIGGRAGLGRLRDTSVTMFTAREGLTLDATVETFAARSGGVWVGTAGGGVSLFKDGRSITYDRRAGLPDDTIGALYEARDRSLYFGVGSNRLVRLRNGRAETINTGNRYVLAIAEDDEGLLLALREAGLVRYRAGRLEPFRTADGQQIKDPFIHVLHRARDGSLWSGAGGLVQVRDGTVRRPASLAKVPGNPFSIYDDAEGVLWVGTGRGLVRIERDVMTTYDTVPDLRDHRLDTVLEDASGDLWMNSSIGILRATKRELNDVAAGRRRDVNVQVFGTQDGLILEEMRAPTVQRGCQTGDGRMWFPTPLGLAVIDPRHLIRDTKAPPVRIEKVIINGIAMDPVDGLRIPARADKVEVHYSSLSYTLPKQATFRYWLEGFDAGWVEAGTARIAHYTKLPPGTYRFRVIAANSQGVWNEQGARLTIVQRPRFHQTAAFRISVLLGVILAIVLVHRVRVHQLKVRERELTQRVDESMAQIKVLRGMLPICASCKKVRTDQGTYVAIESYVQQHSYAEFSHGVCPDCLVSLYPEYAQSLEPKAKS